jgi:NAD-dependent SIR2 family protein deacetylase
VIKVDDRIKKARELIQEADYIVIGAGAGLSDAAGFHYAGERFDKNFKDFKEKYNITDMYTGTFYDYKTEEEKWAFWSRVIKCNVYDTKPTLLYSKLLELIKNKEYFVITTNVDHQFCINGFDMNRYFETQGNYRYFQCKDGCHLKVYDNEEIVKSMVKNTKNCKIPSSNVPKCPVCGKEMDVHVRKDENFVETEGWHYYQNQYYEFLNKALKKNVVFLEFGVGFNTPGIIRYPFERMVYQYDNAHLIRFNKDYDFCLEGNESNVISFNEDILTTLLKLM